LQARLHAAISSLEKAEEILPRAKPGAHCRVEDEFLGAVTAVYLRVNERPRPLGKSVYNLFEAVVETFPHQPTIIYDYPVEVSPLSKAKPDDPAHVERL